MSSLERELETSSEENGVEHDVRGAGRAHCCKMGYLSISGGSAEAIVPSEPLAMLVIPLIRSHESLDVGTFVASMAANGAAWWCCAYMAALSKLMRHHTRRRGGGGW